MKRACLFVVCLLCVLWLPAQTATDWKKLEKDVNFLLGSDFGRNGYYDQKEIAECMGKVSETVNLHCVVAAGDVHHFYGVRSVEDPLWQTNYEWIYSHPGLMLPWFAVMGNHEYRGNTRAVLDYAGVSARWAMKDRYYSVVLNGRDCRVRILLMDTPPLIDKYRKNTEMYPDAGFQDYERQLAWADSVLSEASEDWILVVGHHPVYAQTDKTPSERSDMQHRLGRLLERHPNVDMYICGHLHNFQHIRKSGSRIDYVVNTSASLSRETEAGEGTVFCSGETGFSLVSADKREICLYMLDKKGNVLHTVRRQK